MGTGNEMKDYVDMLETARRSPEYWKSAYEDTCEIIKALQRERDHLKEELKAYTPCSQHGVSGLPDSCWLCLWGDDFKARDKERDEIWLPLLELAEGIREEFAACMWANHSDGVLWELIKKARESLESRDQ